jgi:hypothetical protein
MKSAEGEITNELEEVCGGFFLLSDLAAIVGVTVPPVVTKMAAVQYGKTVVNGIIEGD